jgi:hypothetical protein
VYRRGKNLDPRLRGKVGAREITRQVFYSTRVVAIDRNAPSRYGTVKSLNTNFLLIKSIAVRANIVLLQGLLSADGSRVFRACAAFGAIQIGRGGSFDDRQTRTPTEAMAPWWTPER